jgi:hypothetical protein
VTRVRNTLILYGAVVASAQIVRLVAAPLFHPHAWAGGGTDSSTVAWLLGSTCVSAAVAGLVAGLAVDVPKSLGWALLLGAFAALESGPLVSWKAFSGFPAWVEVTYAVWMVAVVAAIGCFYLVKSRVLPSVARAA